MSSSAIGCKNLNSQIAQTVSDLRLQHSIATGIVLTAAVLLITGGAPAAELSFVGNWYGVGEPDDQSISYIDSYSPDGTFHSEFRKCQRGEVVWRQTETGKWSVANGVLRMVSDTIDGKPERFDNSYRLEFIGGNEFHARLMQPDYVFVEKRLPKFEFPPCYLGS
jgi:hypothetical protein